MKRPAFHILHNMFPLWISMLKLLKKAPKSLPSIKLLLTDHMGNPNLLFKAIQCGGSVQTDSFRWPPPSCEKRARPPLKLMSSCGARPFMTDSFRVYHNGLIMSEGARARSNNGTEYDTAPSTIIMESECEEGSPRDFFECRSLLQDDGSAEEAAPAAPVGGAKVDNLSKRRTMGKLSHHHPSQSDSDCRAHNTIPDTAASKSTYALQRSEAMAKYSRDPCSDFVSSITEMIVAHDLTDSHDLEDLFHCYLHLNAPKHHPTITLAFLTAMAALNATVWDSLYTRC